jgi:hypothetical protein
MNTMLFLRKVFKKTEKSKQVVVDAKQLFLNKQGSEQFKKLLEKGLSVGVVML